jgi:hypothetical protein
MPRSKNPTRERGALAIRVIRVEGFTEPFEVTEGIKKWKTRLSPVRPMAEVLRIRAQELFESQKALADDKGLKERKPVAISDSLWLRDEEFFSFAFAGSPFDDDLSEHWE